QRDDGPAAGPPAQHCTRRACLFGRFPHTVHALHADRGLPLALGAGRAITALAADVGDPVRVTRAGRCCWRRPRVARAAAVAIPVPGAPGPGGWRVTAHALFDDLHRIDHDVLQRTILRSGGGRPDRVDDVDGGLVLHLAEDRVLALEP